MNSQALGLEVGTDEYEIGSKSDHVIKSELGGKKNQN